MKVGDKVKVIARKSHGLMVGEIVNVLYVDDDAIKVDDPDSDISWWLWENEFELLNPEQ